MEEAELRVHADVFNAWPSYRLEPRPDDTPGAAPCLKVIDRVKLRIFSALSDKADLRGMHITAPGAILPVIAPLIAATLYFRPVIDLGSAWKFQLNIYS